MLTKEIVISLRQRRALRRAIENFGFRLPDGRVWYREDDIYGEAMKVVYGVKDEKANQNLLQFLRTELH